MRRNFAVLVVFMLFVCTSTSSWAQQPQAMPKSSTQVKADTVSGTVIETMNASGYTYMLVAGSSGKTWVAIPEATVEKGTTVSYYQGMIMEKFTSKTLNRTFDNLVFSGGLVSDKTQQAAHPAADESFSAAVKAETMAASPAPETVVSAGSAGAIVPLKEISIEKAPAANGYTVGEIFTKAKELAGKKVQVRGKVVKFSPMIMGKNWIHLQDGTGDPMHNSHDLVVTSGETVKLGEIITVEGLLAADKDFGAGYKYAAIIEDANIVK
jgi:hypothetical protein